jgi:hypothetical protein
VFICVHPWLIAAAPNVSWSSTNGSRDARSTARLLAVTLLSSAGPAWRASAVDPLETLRRAE